MTAPMYIDPYRIAAKFIGLKEGRGVVHNPAIVAMLDLCDPGVHDDETAWCSAFVSYCCWLLGVQRSVSLRARSWLLVGRPILVAEARPGFDVVVLSRGTNPAPASVVDAPGHVGFFAGYLSTARSVQILGGNQANQVSIAEFPVERVLGVRRLT